MASLRYERVTKIFPGDVTAVDAVSLDVSDGELLVLVGPSGCGKSTLLRMTAGLETVTSGHIRIGDRSVESVPPRDRDVAMVFQSYALYPHMTVRENLGFGLKLRKVPRETARRAVDDVAEVLGLTPYLERKPRALSGGQRQRVALGRAIVRDPAVFLFDEPLSNLDAALRVEMRAEIRAHHDRLKATMVYVTHDQVEAMTLADRIVVMRDGVVQQVAPPLEVYRRPANRFTASFIGSPPMNFLDGQAAGGRFDGAGLAVAAGSGVRGAVTLGVRPEDLQWEANATGDPLPGSFDMEVRLVEPLGSELYVHGTAGAAKVLARIETPDTPPASGGRHRFRVAPDRLHWFDPQGLRVGDAP